MALDIHDWDEGGERGQGAKEVLDRKEVSEGVDEDIGLNANYTIEEESRKDNVENMLEKKQAVHNRNPDEEELWSDCNENHAKSEVNHAQAGIEEGPVHDGEGNLMSKVNSNTAEVGCSQEKIEKLSSKGTMEDLVDEVVGNVESVDADLRSKRTQAEESTLEISAKQLYENGGSVVWAECSGLSWFPAILPKLSASNIASSISYILPFPAKPASNLVQLFDAEGSWKRVEVVQPLGEDREVDEERLHTEGLVL